MILLFWLACGPDYEESEIEVGRQNCRRMEICGELEILHYDTVDECIADAEVQTYPADQCPDYVPRQMKDCLEAYEKVLAEKDCETDLSDVCDVCK